MEIREYWRIARRRAWIVVLLVVVSVAAAATLTFFTRPQFTAGATVTTHLEAPLSLPEVATSNSLALRVIHDLGLAETVDQLRNQIRVTLVRSGLYRISITDQDPQRATTLANAVAKDAAVLYQELAVGAHNTAATADTNKERQDFQTQYLAAARALIAFTHDHPDALGPNPRSIDAAATARQLQLDEQASSQAYLFFEEDLSKSKVQNLATARLQGATVVDEAAAAPDTGGRTQTIAYAATLALILGIGLVFVLEYLDNSVRQPEEAEALLGMPVVGLIPRGTPRTLRPAKGAAR